MLMCVLGGREVAFHRKEGDYGDLNPEAFCHMLGGLQLNSDHSAHMSEIEIKLFWDHLLYQPPFDELTT